MFNKFQVPFSILKNPSNISNISIAVMRISPNTSNLYFDLTLWLHIPNLERPIFMSNISSVWRSFIQKFVLFQFTRLDSYAHFSLTSIRTFEILSGGVREEFVYPITSSLVAVEESNKTILWTFSNSFRCLLS